MSSSIDDKLVYTTTSSISAWSGIRYGQRTGDGMWEGTFCNNDPSQATENIVCHWSDAENLTNYLLYCNNFIESASGNNFTYYVGAKHLLSNTYCDSVRVIPYTSVTTDFSVFDYAQLEVHYKSLPFDVSNPAEVKEVSVETSGTVVTLPSSSLVASSSGGVKIHPPYDLNLMLPTLKITSTLLGINTVPLGAIVACYGCLAASDVAFNYGGATYNIAADTILYLGANTKRTIMSNGASKYDVSHTFIVSPIHNKVIDPTLTSDNKNIEDVFALPSNGFKAYKTADFSTLGI